MKKVLGLTEMSVPFFYAFGAVFSNYLFQNWLTFGKEMIEFWNLGFSVFQI